MDIGAYLGKKGWIQGHILGEITDLEIENHKNVKKNVLSAHSNKLGQIYVQWATETHNFNIGLSLFGCTEKNTEYSA